MGHGGPCRDAVGETLKIFVDLSIGRPLIPHA